MKIVANNDADCVGTSLSGYVHVPYKNLLEKFGEPTNGDEYKVDAEWILEVGPKKKVITIYNYKDGQNYLGASGMPTEDITEWHLGSSNATVKELKAVAKFVGGEFQPFG